MSRYRQAVRHFRLRYFLGAVLRHNGSVTAAAGEIGVRKNCIYAVLRDAGIARGDVQEMIRNRELLRAGLPPRKPVASVKHSDQFDQIAGLPESRRTA